MPQIVTHPSMVLVCLGALALTVSAVCWMLDTDRPAHWGIVMGLLESVAWMMFLNWVLFK